MRQHLKIFFLTAVLSCLFFGSSTAAKKSARVSWLFAIDAGNATLTHIKGKTYQLTILRKDVQSVLVFSDRPVHIAFRMKLADFEKWMYNGKDSFQKDPPNLALTWGDKTTTPSAYKLVGHKIGKTNLVYSLILVGPNFPDKKQNTVVQQGAVSIYIDNGIYS